MAIVLPALPFEKNALEPHISSQTLSYHYDKHHNTYVVNVNNLIKDTELENKSLEDIIHESANDPSKTAIFNNAAQVWNHTFYWNSLKPHGSSLPNEAIKQKIDSDFGSYDNFAKAFKEAALGQFGSGWAWLVLIDGKLSILKTSNADTPIAHGIKAILCIDVWEHAYYLDYKNARAEYADNVINHLINWDFANANLMS
ncbi:MULTISPECIES: superoxide dismutase [unclassified Sulfuricurvum]|nr:MULTISPECIES: superoxide dismutase [unclassified Sulfuricurvum]OHD83238.1 MAG: superoxide dismutase [Sulfuricurvum sp. RIFCSPHIGHO2_12_FULL_44_8]OHD85965.1 MAG: superoxide dismutase [Sulfuricurvum sp. RIFCSPLOWO2_02_FULL_43_45]OHD87361.1 MAG: superoxide dismutase [Sulfuricurvum sp. RIFCSPLOWO2_02_43_6]OHD87867.1 MAG: superoxide dismutase [Sulfuricurvum sp. RIFCSPLOWO2_12_43_5]AFV98446.1 superoxide dismutase (Fe) [Candidatus Sulfuricurvum sp. RIFRC-1]